MESARDGRRRFAVVLVIATIAFGLTTVSSFAPAAEAAVARTLNGKVTCTNGAAVTGVWMDVGSGTDRFAPKFVMKNAPSIALYSVSLSVATSTTVRVRVGCGGTPSAWASSNQSPSRALTQNETVNLACTGTGTCQWQTAGPEWPPLRVSAMVGCGERTCDGGTYHPYPALDLKVDHQWVYATGPGVVYDVGINVNDPRGKFVAIQHAGGRYSRYLHLAEVGITKGTRVIAGSKLGISGSTGQSTGPHLHYDEQAPYGTPAGLGPIYSFGRTFSSTNPDRSGYAYPAICKPGITVWTQVAADTCAILVNEGV